MKRRSCSCPALGLAPEIAPGDGDVVLHPPLRDQGGKGVEDSMASWQPVCFCEDFDCDAFFPTLDDKQFQHPGCNDWFVIGRTGTNHCTVVWSDPLVFFCRQYCGGL